MLPLKNVKAFNEAFNCQKKEPVCELWWERELACTNDIWEMRCLVRRI
jgi:hypothetical protein